MFTTLVTPSPSAIPFARNDYPAPNGPMSATSYPAPAAVPSARPSDLVCAGEVLANVPLAADVGRSGTRGAAGAAERSMPKV
jgi:hypothetical protein